MEKAERRVKGSNMHWQIKVRPDGEADATVTIPETLDCEARKAVCTDDGRKFSNTITFTVDGPG